jgi:hypothetical protein
MEGVQSYSAMAQEGRKGSTFRTLVFLPISFIRPLLLSPLFSFLSRHREGGKERMADEAHHTSNTNKGYMSHIPNGP